MNNIDKKMYKQVEDLSSESVQELLKTCDMTEFLDFAKEKELDGRKLLNVTEGRIKLWRPQCNAHKLIRFIQDVKTDPEKYVQIFTKEINNKVTQINYMKTEEAIIETILENQETVEPFEKETHHSLKVRQETKMSIESQYQTVKKTKEDAITFHNVEDLIKKIVPAKSFLYRNKDKKAETTSYLPMDAGTPKKRKIFRLSGYDYPVFDLKRFSKPEGDRGYYPMKRNSRFFIYKAKTSESRSKYKSISTTEELKYPEDHFYEDLCYNDVEKRSSTSNVQVKPYRVKIQELFHSFKIPFLRNPHDVLENEKQEEVVQDKRKVVNDMEPMYENSDSMVNMYDSVHVRNLDECVKDDNKTRLPVEEYLEPVQLSKDYCDVTYKQKEDSLLAYIMSIFETRFGYRRETNDVQIEDSEDTTEKWPEDKPRSHMADRPLPVPVENEPYYMDIDRNEAENLLKGQPDGTFVLRPSSQPNHAYTLTVSCNSSVHNIGIRRRPDGRLALGFARKGERSFSDVGALLRHHRKRRLLLVANGAVIGASTLNETPQYYQTPCNIPVNIV